MRIALLCATRRGHLVLEKLLELRPNDDFVVFSFREDPWEPPFLEAIRDLALSRGCSFFEAKQVGSQHWAEFWDSTEIDLLLVVSWRFLIPRRVYERPRHGAFVFHDSLLPAYRGFAPTVWAILNGESWTGATLFRIADEVDAGDVVDQQGVPIGADDTVGVVIERVSEAYLGLLERNLDALLDGRAKLRPQDHRKATYTCKRLPDDNEIAWQAPTSTIYNLIRAVGTPYPGAYTYLAGRRVTVWGAERIADPLNYVGRIPGRIVSIRPGTGSVVLTGDGALLLTQVQVENGEICCAADVFNSIAQTLGRKP